MDSRDKFSGGFRATDGMSGKMDKGKTPAPRGNNGMVDCSVPIMPKRSYGSTPSSTGVGGAGKGMKSSAVGGRTRAAHNQG